MTTSHFDDLDPALFLRRYQAAVPELNARRKKEDEEKMAQKKRAFKKQSQIQQQQTKPQQAAVKNKPKPENKNQPQTTTAFAKPVLKEQPAQKSQPKAQPQQKPPAALADQASPAKSPLPSPGAAQSMTERKANYEVLKNYYQAVDAFCVQEDLSYLQYAVRFEAACAKKELRSLLKVSKEAETLFHPYKAAFATARDVQLPSAKKVVALSTDIQRLISNISMELALRSVQVFDQHLFYAARVHDNPDFACLPEFMLSLLIKEELSEINRLASSQQAALNKEEAMRITLQSQNRILLRCAFESAVLEASCMKGLRSYAEKFKTASSAIQNQAAARCLYSCLQTRFMQISGMDKDTITQKIQEMETSKHVSSPWIEVFNPARDDASSKRDTSKKSAEEILNHEYKRLCAAYCTRSGITPSQYRTKIMDLEKAGKSLPAPELFNVTRLPGAAHANASLQPLTKIDSLTKQRSKKKKQ